MDITIQNIELDECYEELTALVPFRSFPVRSVRTDNKYKLRSFAPAKHPLWIWVSYKEVEPFKINPRGDSYSSIIDVTLHSVNNFTLDYDEMRVIFDDGTNIRFDLPIERYSNMQIDACY